MRCAIFSVICRLLLLIAVFCTAARAHADDLGSRPNILFCIADDWGWPFAGAYGDPVVKAPTFDRIAREGVLFRNAFVTSPSCTPSRSAILTGQWHWRLEAGANLHCIFPDKFATYPELLAKAGYAVGKTNKAWGPGRTQTEHRPIAGNSYKSIHAFLAKRPKGQPFCFWLGSGDPHRPYELGSGEASGMKLDVIKVPPCFPDAKEIRGDIADYYFEVHRFDKHVADAIAAVDALGELDNTIIVVTGDHGWPFPRGKANLYDTGVHVPLAIRWSHAVKANRVVDDFVSLSDLAPTFLEFAGVERPHDMTGRSLAGVLTSEKSGQVDATRDHVLFGKERHVPMQEKPDMGGYPCRGIRTHDYLYIRNFTPERWPVGTPDWQNATIRGVWLGDTDNGPTKTYLVDNRDRDDVHRRAYDWSFAKRPPEELYDLKNDLDQLANVAAESGYAAVKQELSERLLKELGATGDWRVQDRGEDYFKNPYLGEGPKHPDFEAERRAESAK